MLVSRMGRNAGGDEALELPSVAKENKRSPSADGCFECAAELPPFRTVRRRSPECHWRHSARLAVQTRATLAFGGTNPVTKKTVMDPAKVPGVLAVMATAGLYDDSGKWLYRTGLPAKSGVGGGLIAVSPGKFGIAVVSPPLDDAGNSVRAQKAITDVSNALGGNPLGR